MAPINCFMYAFSAIPTKPQIDANQFSDLNVLRQNWQMIRDEAVGLMEGGEIKISKKFDDLAFNSFFRRGWKRYYLKWYGNFLPSAKRTCPKTVELLNDLKSINAAMFAVLPPGATLVRHRDPYAGSLRYHLGLSTPNDERCFIDVDGIRYHWRDGEDVVFDESFIHYAANETDTDRLILFCDVERPMRWGWAKALNRFFSRVLMETATSRNEAEERIGIINKFFGVIYPIRAQAKKVKAYNRKLYYGLKYALFGGIVFLILY